MKKILFLSYGGGHIAMLLPVIRAYRARYPSNETTLVALTIAGAAARQAGEPYLGYKDFLHLVDEDAALAAGRRLFDGHGGGSVDEAESLAYLGINMLELEARLGPKGAALALERDGRAAFQPRDFMRRVLGWLAPDLVISTNSPRSEEAVLHAAHALEIPCLSLVDLLEPQAAPLAGRGYWPNKVAVLNEDVARYLEGQGAPEGAVEVTGNPAFDKLVQPEVVAEAERYKAQLGFGGKKIILYAGDIDISAPPERARDLPRRVGEALAGLVKSRDDVALILRYHPSRWQDMPQPPAHPRIHVSVPQQEPVHPVLVASDLLVVQLSTIALEGAIAGKPVISLEKLSESPASLSWAEHGISTACEGVEDIGGLAGSALDTPQSYIKTYKTDGLATSRICDLITQLNQLSG